MLPWANLAEIKQLVAAFEQATLPRPEWTHRAHLTVAAWYLAKQPVALARPLIRGGIRKLNAALGIVSDADHGYHETITQFYVGLIAHHLHQTAGDVAQASSPARSPGVPPGVPAGREPRPQLAAGTGCASGSRKMVSLVDAVNALLASRGHVGLPMEYYSRERLLSREARAHWVEPDLKPFEWGGSDGCDRKEWHGRLARAGRNTPATTVAPGA